MAVAAESSVEDALLVLANRSFVYALLSRAFAEEPDADFLDLYRSEHTEHELMLIEDGCSGPIVSAYGHSLDLLDCAAGSLEEAVCMLAVEYARIFIGPETLLSSPWESMHVSGKRVLFQPEVLAVRSAYREAGYLPASYPRVSDDALALEVDFMNKLASRALDAYQADDREGVRGALTRSACFLDEHLGRWACSFASAVNEHYDLCFYGMLAQILASYVGRDRALLAVLMDIV